MKTIHWLTSSKTRSIADLKSTRIASIRLRTAVALAAVEQRGVAVSNGDLIAGEVPDILIVGKAGGGFPAGLADLWRGWIGDVKARGGKVVLDYTDHLFFEDTPVRSQFYRDIIGALDVVVCPGAQMKHNVGGFFSGPCVVIEDAIDVESVAPKNFLHKPLCALWFGGYSNLGYLATFLVSLPQKTKLRVIALTDEAGLDGIKNLVPHLPPKVQIEPGPWSVETMIAAARRADLCLIPSDVNDPRKNGASSNRLITALALGLPTAADLLGSYREFADFFVNIRGPAFDALLANPTRYAANVTAAQKAVCPNFRADVLGAKWCDFLNAL